MTHRIPQSFIQDLVARADIVPIVEARVALKKRGNNATACCPFHHEKTPSFTVSQVKQFYYCFGCGAHGNVIGFLMAYDRLSFVDAVTHLAQQLGVEVPHEGTDENTAQYDILYQLLEHAETQYQKQLAQSSTAIDYLKSRGLTGKTAKAFGIGFAPDAWEFIHKSLGKNNEDRQALKTAGMLIEKESGHYYDRFRNRIMFPIRDTRGRIIGFGGRTITDETPKYLNSPETPIFHKNQTLYGLYEVNQQHHTLTRALVVEGYMDVIALAQQGINYAVATLGTALNIKHIQNLLRYTSKIIFCFDGDEAGKKAAWKALTISLPVLRDGLDIQFLFLPEKEDPDSLVQKIGHEKFEQLIDHATPLVDVFFQQLEVETPIDTIAGKAAFSKKAHELLQPMPQGLYKNLLLDALAQRLQVTRPGLLEPQKKTLENTAKKPTMPLEERLTPLQRLIQLLLHQPALVKHAVHHPVLKTLEDTAEKRILFDLINRCKQSNVLHIGELLTQIDIEAHRSCIAQIASHPLYIPFNGQEAEFLGTLEGLRTQHQDKQRTILIQKKKTTGLDSEEEQLLQLLMAEKAATHNRGY